MVREVTGNMKSKYIVTNTTTTGEYTPSVFDELEEARIFLLKTTAKNLVAGYDNRTLKNAPLAKNAHNAIELMENDEWGDTSTDLMTAIEYGIMPYINSQGITGATISITPHSSVITYSDDTENRMNIYVIIFDEQSDKVVTTQQIH